MKKFLLLSILLLAVVANAQHAYFRGTNNYVAPVSATSQANALNFSSSLQNYATLPAQTKTMAHNNAIAATVSQVMQLLA